MQALGSLYNPSGLNITIAELKNYMETQGLNNTLTQRLFAA